MNKATSKTFARGEAEASDQVIEKLEYCVLKSCKGTERLYSVLDFVERMTEEGVSADGLGVVLLLLEKGYISESMKATAACGGLLCVAEREQGINADTGTRYFSREPFFTEKGMKVFASLMKERCHE